MLEKRLHLKKGKGPEIINMPANSNIHHAFCLLSFMYSGSCETMTEMNKYNNIVIYDWKITL